MEKLQAGSDILSEIEHRFSVERSRCGGKRNWYSTNLKQLALSAIELGNSQREVASSAKISRQSLKNWICRAVGQRQIQKPLELTLVTEKKSPGNLSSPTSRSTACDESRAKISFRSGATLELPVSSLNAGLISILNQESSETPGA